MRPTSLRPKFPPFVVNPYKLVVSYNFTIRTGCAVQVNQIAEDAVQVTVVLNAAGYKAPPLPNRRDVKFNNDDIEKLNETAGLLHLLSPVLLPIVAPLLGPLLANPIARVNFTQAVARGVETDAYDDAPLQVEINHTRNQVNNVLASKIVQGAGITVDNKQPYPLYGWLEAKWVDTTTVHP